MSLDAGLAMKSIVVVSLVVLAISNQVDSQSPIINGPKCGKLLIWSSGSDTDLAKTQKLISELGQTGTAPGFDDGPKSGSHRIVGGQEASPGRWPWQVILKFSYNTTHTGWCGGTIINKDFILGAASCSEKDNVPVTVLAGSHYYKPMNKSEQVIAMDRMILFPGFQQHTSRGYNIALIKLKKSLTFNKLVRPICLPEQDELLEEDTKVTITGFGLTSVNPDKRPKVLHEAK